LDGVISSFVFNIAHPSDFSVAAHGNFAASQNVPASSDRQLSAHKSWNRRVPGNVSHGRNAPSMPMDYPSTRVGICEGEISQPFEISSFLAEMLELINYFTKLTHANATQSGQLVKGPGVVFTRPNRVFR
jgi:hypothetical protein